VSFLLACPNCGARRVDEFRFGGEYHVRPDGEVTPEEWSAYLYERANLAGPQREWWYHRYGCKRWFIAVRDTTTNTVLETAWLATSKGSQHAQASDAESPSAAGDGVSGPRSI
jgi:heterotetrameric sarcosine oxidase delta subunit